MNSQRRDKIITIEDPVEYVLRDMQIHGKREEGIDVCAGLRSILRHDPDKVMVGEIRDGRNGADRRSSRALTGHLVFTTVPR